MRWAFGCMLFYRVGVLWLLTTYASLSLTGVWIVMTVDLVTQALIFARLYRRGKWLEARV